MKLILALLFALSAFGQAPQNAYTHVPLYMEKGRYRAGNPSYWIILHHGWLVFRWSDDGSKVWPVNLLCKVDNQKKCALRSHAPRQS